MKHTHTSLYWLNHFKSNLQQKRINWQQPPMISIEEIERILPSLQAWQLGETSEGRQLMNAAAKHARKTADPYYLDAVALFIKEEQKHGNNLGKYMDMLDLPRVKRNWGDSLFRFIRHFNTSMEMWTLTVLTEESAAQIFYQSLKDATNCLLLKEVCTDILIDEAYHITFQAERLDSIYSEKPFILKVWRVAAYKIFFYLTMLVVWMAHRRLFKAGGVYFKAYYKKIQHKYARNIRSITGASGYVTTSNQGAL